MTRWIRRGNGNCVLCSDSGRFLKDAVTNLSILSYIGRQDEHNPWLLARVDVGVRSITLLPLRHLRRGSCHTNLCLDFLDLLNCLLFIESVDEEIDVRSRRQLLMVILAKRTL